MATDNTLKQNIKTVERNLEKIPKDVKDSIITYAGSLYEEIN